MDLVKAGVVGFKCFMCPSGVDEFPYVTLDDIESAMKILENTSSVLAVCKYSLQTKIWYNSES